MITVEVFGREGNPVLRMFDIRQQHHRAAARWCVADWVGGAAVPAGVSGACDTEDLLRVFGLPSQSEPVIAGVEIIFQPMRSLCFFAALGDDEQAHRVVTAHSDAVQHVLKLLEREAVVACSGPARLDAAGLVGLLFNDFLPDEDEPVLRTHALVSWKTVAANRNVWLPVDLQRLHEWEEVAYEAYVTGLTVGAGLHFEPRPTGRSPWSDGSTWELPSITEKVMDGIRDRHAQRYEPYQYPCHDDYEPGGVTIRPIYEDEFPF